MIHRTPQTALGPAVTHEWITLVRQSRRSALVTHVAPYDNLLVFLLRIRSTTDLWTPRALKKVGLVRLCEVNVVECKRGKVELILRYCYYVGDCVRVCGMKWNCCLRRIRARGYFEESQSKTNIFKIVRGLENVLAASGQGERER